MMAIVGSWTWWAPAPLQRVVKYLNLSEVAIENDAEGTQDYEKA